MAQRRRHQGKAAGRQGGGVRATLGKGVGAGGITAGRPHDGMRKRAAVALVVCVLATGLAGLGWWGSSRGIVLERDGEDVASQSEASVADGGDAPAAVSDSSQEGSGDDAASSDAIVVDVGGQVVNPGVYELAGDKPRVNDAIQAAGGLTEQAYVAGINLASTLADGDKVQVPTEEEATAAATPASAAAGTAGGSGTSSAGTSVGGASATSLVNINTATVEELQQLSGVGPSTAAAIVQDRADSGSFTSIEDLMRVSGIGEKKFAKIKDSICV